MTRQRVCVFLLILVVSVANGQSQKNATGSTANKQKAPTTFTDRLLKFLGISDSPSTLKGPGDEVVSGELWIADLDSKNTRAITPDGGYRSPVFMPGMKNVLALRGSDVLRVPSAAGAGSKLYSIDSIIKLVGFGSEDPGKVLILLRGEAGGHPRVGLLTISTGAVTIVPYDPTSSQDLHMVEDLQGWSRTYGNQQIFVKRQTKEVMSGTVEWTDVFRNVNNEEPFNVSQCNGVNCGQPSLSENGRLLVFVKAKSE
jgi:hypothetical protein